ncbi:unnamed protein product [Gongylonema pulchrum]|uniref:Tudor domain-containing protein n=1 Tax=Gongylonema pulchrum TaxID=637853 RepID=A0A183DTX6_9BILA|nr:unnamed protein product [Gongylonema pulchrum]
MVGSKIGYEENWKNDVLRVDYDDEDNANFDVMEIMTALVAVVPTSKTRGFRQNITLLLHKIQNDKQV